MALYTPWRMEYISSVSRNREGCFMCEAAAGRGEFVVYRGEYCVVLMNKYPYNRGHLLIAPRRHVPSLRMLTRDELYECAALLKASTCALSRLLKPDDFNIGVNVGRVAGAGYEEHVHFHIVPRWIGDVGNIPTSYSMEDVLRDLRELAEGLSKLIVVCLNEAGYSPKVHTP